MRGRNKGIVWDEVSDLGKVPDSEIARRLGVSIPVVCVARHRRGIPAWQRRHEVARDGATHTVEPVKPSMEMTSHLREHGIISAIGDLDDAARRRVIAYVVSMWGTK